MNFLGIGGWEILLILVVALILLGPQKLPETARKMGKYMRALKKASNDFTSTITREIDLEEKKEPPAEVNKKEVKPRKEST
jgi:sec-independent protein translocase protein TatA